MSTALPKIDTEFMFDFLVKLLNTPSPTGFAHHAVALTSEVFKQFPEIELTATRKGGLVGAWPGEPE